MSTDISRRLLAWYTANRRDLPWRRTRDPYRIWVSEIMLQQTRVDTATPYYERFLERFPTVQALASAPVDEVLAAWSGLGYYRRARQLHAAAVEISQGEGALPNTSVELARLPGIGAYTAAAIASIAFGEPTPVMDGNVERVISRWLATDEDPKKAAPRRRLLATAAELLDPVQPGESNQALMELGATICTPRTPRCCDCPLAGDCRARATGDPERFPKLRERRATVKLFRRVAVVVTEGKFFLFRRPEDSEVLAGTWELPWIEGPRQEFLVAESASLAASEAGLAGRYGGRWRLGKSRGTVRHAITHRAITLEVREAVFEAGETVAEAPEAGLFSRRELGQLALSSQVSKVLKRYDPGL